MAAPQTILTVHAHKQRGKFFYLLVAQVLLIALFPYLNRPGLPIVMFRLLGVLVFLTGIYAVSEKQVQWVIALALAVPAGILNSLSTLRNDARLAVPGLTFAILFLAYTVVTLLRSVLRAQSVTPDTIYGAISVYLLMALLWGSAYLLLETLQPGALALDSARHPNHRIDWFDCMYFSFVTLTSTGFGDMVPITAQSRSLSILEAVSGIMYVAVLVARLVGLYSSTKADFRA